jgi:hypothetical protein
MSIEILGWTVVVLVIVGILGYFGDDGGIGP